MKIKTLNTDGIWKEQGESNWVRLQTEDGKYLEVIYREGKWELHADKSFLIHPTSQNTLKLSDA